MKSDGRRRTYGLPGANPTSQCGGTADLQLRQMYLSTSPFLTLSTGCPIRGMLGFDADAG